jgi:hypothetical protein
MLMYNWRAALLPNFDANGGWLQYANNTGRFKMLRERLAAVYDDPAAADKTSLFAVFDINCDEFLYQRTRHRELTSVLFRISNCRIQVPSSSFSLRRALC